MRRSTRAAAALAALLCGAAPVAADWLVTRDGLRVETRGSWTVKGKLVVFKRADGGEGQLASLRVADVDWAESERATAAQNAAPASAAADLPVASAKESKWVFTDADFKPHTPPAAAKKEETPAAEETDAAGRPRVPVVVDSWDRKNVEGGLEIVGTLRNSGQEVAAEVGVTVRLYDETGALAATAEGRIGAPAIGPQERTPFRASFPGVFTYADAKLEVRGYGLRIKAAAEP
jgi:hypothetical protein